MKSALLILGIFIVFYAVRAQFSGYSVTGTVSSEVNVLFECLMILLPLAFYVVANWCFTTLMDGEGSLKDIFIASCTALKPYLLFSIPLFLCSHLLTQNEAVFYQTADALCWIWVVGPAVPRHDDDPRLFFVQGSSGHAAHHRGHLLDYLHRPAVHQRGAGRGVLLPGYLHRSVLPILLKEASS